MIGYNGVSEHEHILNIPEILYILEFSDWSIPRLGSTPTVTRERSCTPTPYAMQGVIAGIGWIMW